ncbi:MAG TPA: sigma-54-dependent Fis family transcriptional regulator [Anaeromyxobacteraceae bacterium]
MRVLDTRSTALQRRQNLERAWLRYVQDGVEPEGVSPEISSSWRRAKESYRIDPELRGPIRVLTADALAERRRSDPVLRLATPILREFAHRLGAGEHVLCYFDADGHMLSIDGHPRVVEGVAEIDFRPGACWAEESAGTNGPGTALAEGKALEVFASEHYVAAWQRWSCAGAPIRAPGSAAPVGLVDITGPWESQRRQALVLAKAIARAIEERLRAGVSVLDEVIRYAFRAARSSGEALVAVDAHGRVLAANDAAARRQLLEAGSLPRVLREALDAALRAGGDTPGGELPLAPSPGAHPVWASTVCYEGAPIGAILRASVAAPAPRAAGPRARPSTRYELSRILGAAEPLLAALDLARVAARNDLPVVLTGESGTGKELFAQAIHGASARRERPFVALNCGSIPAELLEAELFGYEGGAFTGGRREGRPGRFEDADGGTLFLDEVSELSGPAQTALLRVLQEKEIVRVGASLPQRVDVRVIAATNKPLEGEIQARRFRRDLYYRLHVLAVPVPPLRDRGEDVTLLARVFLAEAEGELGRRGLTLAPDAIAALRAHPWPGNVRELRNVMLRAAATSPRPEIRASDLGLDPLLIPGPAPAATAGAGTGQLRETLLASERETLLSVLQGCSWNVARAAQQLGVSRMTLYRKLHRCGLSRTTAAC